MLLVSGGLASPVLAEQCPSERYKIDLDFLNPQTAKVYNGYMTCMTARGGGLPEVIANPGNPNRPGFKITCVMPRDPSGIDGCQVMCMKPAG